MQQVKDEKTGRMTLVALGANQGDASITLEAATRALRDIYGDVAQSRLFKTPAFPAGSGPDFVNAAAAFVTDEDPSSVLATLHDIEADFNRKRDTRWGPRTLDLDLIACGDLVQPDLAGFEHWRGLSLDAQKTTAPDRLILPHPRLQDRPFVLVPLSDVVPDWTHPVLGATVTEMIATFTAAQLDEIEPL